MIEFGLNNGQVITVDFPPLAKNVADTAALIEDMGFQWLIFDDVAFWANDVVTIKFKEVE